MTDMTSPVNQPRMLSQLHCTKPKLVKMPMNAIANRNSEMIPENNSRLLHLPSSASASSGGGLPGGLAGADGGGLWLTTTICCPPLPELIFRR